MIDAVKNLPYKGGNTLTGTGTGDRGGGADDRVRESQPAPGQVLVLVQPLLGLDDIISVTLSVLQVWL